MPVKKKSGVSRDEWREAGKVLDFIVIGGLRVPEYIRDLASWLEGPGSGVSTEEMDVLLGDHSIQTVKAAAESLLECRQVKLHVRSRLDENNIKPRCARATIESALRVILERRMLAGRA